MSFYNTYRPRQFSDVLGQGQTIALLKKQALTGKYHHAYLLFGDSGTGKTTTARILASCFNCLNLDGTGEPCGECDSCRTIYEGHNWDVIELDAGRFRGIDDIKDLAYKAHFSPIGNKKVYIIDECQMLTEPAWNGMLKLLEEPPPHLVIILCTTDTLEPDSPHFKKIPKTIASRCQLFPFSKLGVKDIKGKLERICKDIGIAATDGHIQFIAEGSDGNMRAAENTLEQLVEL